MSDLYIDVKYVKLLSGRLRNFKIKKSNPFLANFSCDFCGDSEKHKYKARGYIFQKKSSLLYKCHHCGVSHSLGNFIKQVDIVLYEQYSVEAYVTKNSNTSVKEVKPDISIIVTPKFLNAGSPLKKLKKISQLVFDHPAKKYILDRKIENKHHSKLFYCSKFAAWTNSIIPEKMDTTRDEPRLIIPFLKEDGTLFGYQGRSFDPNTNLRYITIMLEDLPKIFGLDTINKNARSYVFEGPLDSLFIPNSIAMAGADVVLDKSFSDVVYILDNEPRNKEIVKRLDSFINKGYNVVVWDNTFKGKDINEMILNGADAEHIKIIIDKRTYKGLEATVELMNWKKC